MDELNFMDKNVILFIGNDYWKNKIYNFDFKHRKFNFIEKLPKNLISHNMYNKKHNYSLLDVFFLNENEVFLFDTGATLIRNNINSAISFLDGIIFDKIKDDYKIILNYDDDVNPCLIIPEIIIFNTIVKNVKFLRRHENAFIKFFTKITGIKHIGAIGNNVLKYFNIVADFKNKKFYTKD